MAWNSVRSGWLYRLTVPWWWLIVAIISWQHPGDEYGLFAITHGLPSGFLSVLLLRDGSLFATFATLLAFSFVSISLLSWGLDRLRVSPEIFLLIYGNGTALLVIYTLNQYESYHRAMQKNGSLTAYVSAGSNLCLFGTCLLCLAIFGAWRLWQRFEAPVAS